MSATVCNSCVCGHENGRCNLSCDPLLRQASVGKPIDLAPLFKSMGARLRAYFEGEQADGDEDDE